MIDTTRPSAGARLLLGLVVLAASASVLGGCRSGPSHENKQSVEQLRKNMNSAYQKPGGPGPALRPGSPAPPGPAGH